MSAAPAASSPPVHKFYPHITDLGTLQAAVHPDDAAFLSTCSDEEIAFIIRALHRGKIRICVVCRERMPPSCLILVRQKGIYVDCHEECTCCLYE